MPRIVIALFLVFSALILNACSLNQVAKTKQSLENSKFTLVSVQPKISIKEPTISLNGISKPEIKVYFDIVINIDNTTDYNLAMNRLDLNLYIDDLELASATTNKHLRIPKHTATDMSLTVNVDPKLISTKLIERLQGNQIEYKAKATFYFRVLNWDIPISKTLGKQVI